MEKQTMDRICGSSLVSFLPADNDSEWNVLCLHRELKLDYEPSALHDDTDTMWCVESENTFESSARGLQYNTTFASAAHEEATAIALRGD